MSESLYLKIVNYKGEKSLPNKRTRNFADNCRLLYPSALESYFRKQTSPSWRIHLLNSCTVAWLEVGFC